MTHFDERKWKYLTDKYPELAGLAYEIYIRDPKKSANPVTYFMWASKTEWANEKRYRENLTKYRMRKKPNIEE